jgi:hypothetical protein
MTHGAPHDFPQDVAAPLIRREDAVGNQERHGPQVVRDDSHRDVRVVGHVDRGRVAAPRAFADGVENRREEVRVVGGNPALQDRGHALETHPGVD